MNVVAVRFYKGGREYHYKTPYLHHPGDLIIVDVSGELNVVTVSRMIDEDAVSFSGTLKNIHGIGYTLADLEQPIVESKPTLFQTLARHFADR